MRFIASFEASAATATATELSRLCFEVGTTWWLLDAGGFRRRWLVKPELRHGDGEFDIARLGALLETHKSLQQSLWPSIESPTIRAVYEALAPLSHGSFICGAGSGGHIIALLKSSATADAVTDAVRSCSSAPEARVVDVTLLL